MVVEGWESWLEATVRRCLLTDFHAANEPTLDHIYVLYGPIQQGFPRAIKDDLVYLYYHPALCITVEFHGFDVRIEHGPLPRPIFADPNPAMNRAAFHSVWPQDIWLHRG